MQSLSELKPSRRVEGSSLPRWLLGGSPEGAECTAFFSGAALASLDLVLSQNHVPQALLRDRLALQAAQASAGFIGRPVQVSALRDEVHLLRPAETPGPAGQIYQHWRRVCAHPLATGHFIQALPAPDGVAELVDETQQARAPVAAAAEVLQAVLAAHPRQEVIALILADAALTRALGWSHITPLLAAGLARADLRREGRALEEACHRAVLHSARKAVTQAQDLAQKARALQAVQPKLRSKQAAEAVALFLSRDALSPSVGLVPLMSDRAARRLCERLVGLGVLRELTQRDTFRLYGL